MDLVQEDLHCATMDLIGSQHRGDRGCPDASGAYVNLLGGPTLLQFIEGALVLIALHNDSARRLKLIG